MNKYIFLIFSFLLIITGCKKTTEYRLSPQIKNYFTFKTGSYWIYRNDSTGELDSSYVTSISNHINEREKQKVSWEVLVVKFNSLFLKSIDVYLNSCKQNNYARIVGGGFTDDDTFAGVIYYSEWPQKTILSPECDYGTQYYYEFKQTDTIDAKIYQDVLFCEIWGFNDSSQWQSYRRISYSPDFGILKYYVEDNNEKLNRSFTLIRSKIIK